MNDRWTVRVPMFLVIDAHGATSAEEAIRMAMASVTKRGVVHVPRECIGDIQASWVDDMDVGHLEDCEGTHCRHYSCNEPGDDVPWFCTQCDPEAY